MANQSSVVAVCFVPHEVLAAVETVNAAATLTVEPTGAVTIATGARAWQCTPACLDDSAAPVQLADWKATAKAPAVAATVPLRSTAPRPAERASHRNVDAFAEGISEGFLFGEASNVLIAAPTPAEQQSSAHPTPTAKARRLEAVYPTSLAELLLGEGRGWHTERFLDRSVLERFRSDVTPLPVRAAPVATMAAYRELSRIYERLHAHFAAMDAALGAHEDLCRDARAWLASPEARNPVCASCRASLEAWFAACTPVAVELSGTLVSLHAYLQEAAAELSDYTNMLAAGLVASA